MSGDRVEDEGFRFDGGAAWLNLAATVGRAYSPAPVERLPDPTALDRWLARAGLPTTPANPTDLHTARTLRAAFRSVGLALTAGAAPSRDDLALITRQAARHRVDLGPDGPRWPDPDAALAAVAVTALTTIGSPERAQLARCQAPECAWVFLDPGGRRHWCPAGGCGNRSRVRAHRARANTPD